MKSTTYAAIAASLLASSSDALHLVKRSEPRVVAMELQRRHPGAIVASNALRRRANTIGQTLDNIESGSLYFCNTTIGTPPQTFRFHIDTGSSDLWANVESSEACTQGDNSGLTCADSGTYDANSSSTYQYVNSNFQISYADNTGAQGDYVKDDVTIGGATIKAQEFGVGYKSTSAEGVMGIGYPTLEAFVANSQTGDATPYPNLPQSMVAQGLIGAPAYSLWLDDINSATGAILFGGIDTEKYSGSLVSLDIVKEDFGSGSIDIEMVVELDGISVNVNGKNSTALSSPTNVLLDSGSTLSYIPTQAAQTIYQAVGAKYVASQGVAGCACSVANSSDTMSFSFGNGQKVIQVAIAEMVLPGAVSPSLDCTFGIVQQDPTDQGVSYTLGDTFIRNAYIVYDLGNNQISLAQTNRDSTSSNIMDITNGTDGVPDVTGSASPAQATANGGSGAVSGGGSSSSSAFAMPTAAPDFAAAVIAGAGIVLAAL